MATTTKMGQLIKMPGVRDMSVRVEDSPKAPLKGDVSYMIKSKIMGSIMQTFNTWSSLDGKRGVKPRVEFRITPTHLRYEMTVDLMETGPALEWFNNQFSLHDFRASLEVAITRSLAKWSAQEYDYACVADDSAVSVIGR